MTDETKSPPPAWAVEMAAKHGDAWDHTTEERNDLARLLVSVWDAAMTTIRKALSDSCACRKVGDRVLYGDGYQGYRIVTQPEVCIQCASILLLAKAGPPREATR